MKRKIVFGLLLLVGSLLIAEKMPKKLVSEEVTLSSAGSRYWEFIVPNSSNYIEIECISTIGLDFAGVLPTKKDAFLACNGYNFDHLTGTAMDARENEEQKYFTTYHKEYALQTLRTYYKELGLQAGEDKVLYFFVHGREFVDFFDLGFTNNILVEITAY